MRKNKILEKLLAIILIFTLTSANFLFVGESYAASFAEILFGEKSDTGHENIGFDAYFETEDGNSTSVVSDVNNKDLSVSLSLDVRDAGYLKDAKIEVTKTEEEKELNFVLREMEELPELVQGFENNTIYFQQLNSSLDEIKVNLPIDYKNEAYVNEQKFTNDALVKFSGIYVDDEGEEHEVSKEITINVSWEDEREVRVETAVTKYINFEAGIILQTLVKIDTQTEENSLPIKNSEVIIDVPEFGGNVPSNITVVANSTAGTNGRTAGNVEFSQDNWSYNELEGKINISIENEKQLVVVDEFADEYLKEENEEIIEEERYCNITSADEYLITYTYPSVQTEEEIVALQTNIEARVTVYGGVENKLQTNINDYEYILEGKIGEVVSLNIEDETKEVSKGYVYSNYNDSERYETEFLSKTLANVSYKDIVNKIIISDVDNMYVYKDGTEVSTNDVYYKQIYFSKDNFIEILGEEGYVKVLDLEGNEISFINNEVEANEEGNIVINLERPTRLNIELSKPINEGNFIISNVKAMTNSSLDKGTYSNVDRIKTVAIMRAEFDYIESVADVDTAEINTNLTDTTTKANLVLDRDALSTLALNEDVEIKIELNNHTENSDVYGHSVYEIEFPEYVQSVEITNTSVLYGEGLDISAVEVIEKTIRITVDGKQQGINSGVLSNGTNLVLNANIKVDLYTPAKSEVVKLRYSNDEATNYETEGYTEYQISYSAPTGLVAVNSTSNYNAVGDVTTSVRQGTVEDLIDIFAEAKVATMEIIVMNNNGNTVSNVSILGRIPFKGVKDIATGEDLGTTLDTKFVTGLVPDVHNNAVFNVYYSENAEANNNLEDSSNGWVMNPENLENMKSYLIVPQDENYEMQDTEILRFTYEYEIPGNLSHNEDIYGTFLAYYTNNSNVAVTDETTTPDKIGLTTGEGPELALNVDTDRTVVKENEEMRIDVTVSNLGNNKVEEINVNIPVPENSKFSKTSCIDDSVLLMQENGNIIATCSTLEVENEMKFSVYVNAKQIPASKSAEELYITPTAAVTAKDLGTTLEAVGNKVQIEETELSLEIEERNDIDDELEVQKAGAEVVVKFVASNLTNREMQNTKIVVPIPNEITLEKVVSIETTDDGFTVVEKEIGNYDESSRIFEWNLGTLSKNAIKQFKIYVKVNELAEEQKSAQAEIKATISAEGTQSYDSNTFIIKVGKVYLTTTQSTSVQDTYIKEGDTVDYIFTIRNEGSATARNVALVDELPTGLNLSKIKYVINGVEGTKRVSSSRKASVSATINPGQEFVVTVTAVVGVLNGVQEMTVTNVGTISGDGLEATQTNSITHIIEQSEKIYHGVSLLSTTREEEAGSNNSNITKTYRVSGTAWNDSNRDGMRTSNESLLSGIKVSLVNSETGKIQKTITTDSAGSYTFTGVENGNYLIVFDYDTAKYTVTSYKKDGVSASVNSDAVITKVDQDGVSRTAAITDVITIENGSVSGIDIGLVLSDKFDLKLDKTITKVLVQNANGNLSTDEYEGTTFAKTEIAAKYLSGSTVHIEYEFKVTNAGELAGYAKKLVDYIPEGMTFNSSLEANKDWYTGTDGNLYSTAFAETELTPGESKTIKLVLTKQITEENTGIVNNLAEICEDYNIYGISDANSTPGNKAQGENDLGSADVAVLIKTGEQLIYISVIITTILLGSIVVFITYNKIVLRRKKGGV